MNRYGQLTAVAFLLAFTAPVPHRAGESLEEFRVDDRGFIIGFAPKRWHSLAQPVGWRIHQDGIMNNSSAGNTTPVSVDETIAALEGTFGQWNSIPESVVAAVFDQDCLLTGLHPGVQCQDGKTSTALTGVDGENIMTWTDPEAAAVGALGITVIFSLQDDLILTASNRDLDGDGNIDLSPDIYPDGTFLPTGTIVDADVSYNAIVFDWITEPTPDLLIVDIVGISLHEQGHWFGYAHSPLIEPVPVMFPLVDLRSLSRQIDMRVLTLDDRASAMRVYPLEPTHSDHFGAVQGRLVNGNGTPIPGEPVVAIDPVSLDRVAFGFSAHALREGSNGEGTFRIVGLPIGEYLIQIGTLDGTFEYLNRLRYNATTTFSDPGGHRPAFAVGAGLESASDDLSPPRLVTVPEISAGGAVDLGDIVVNTDPPDIAPLAGTLPLQFGDNEAILVEFPEGFLFPFYGIEYRQMFVYDNGYVTFTNAISPIPDPITIRIVGTSFADESLDEFLTHSPRIGVLFRNHDPSEDNQGQSTGEIDVYLDPSSERVSLTWAVVPEVIFDTKARPVRADTFALNLFADGTIEMLYGSLSTPYGTVGITPGGTGVQAQRVDLSEFVFFQAAPLEAIVEETSMGRLDFDLGVRRFFDGMDLSGARLLFLPGVDFAYALSRPALQPPEVSPPGSSTPLEAAGAQPTLLTWEPVEASFNLYRGLLSVLASTGVYTPDSSACLGSALGVPQFTDTDVPPLEDGYCYLVAAEIAGVEGPLGDDSAGNGRPNDTPCP
ncbi:MAG: carboxypeptidase-like regulatory domain-containing protein [Acidobacteria bacterium]|nr:carboxypeptidase-like regulatory domain-containing protein [Acidobacteriota bacterium]